MAEAYAVRKKVQEESIKTENSLLQRLKRELKASKIALLGAVLVLLVLLLALFSVVDKYIFHESLIKAILYGPNEMDIMAQMQAPSLKHPLGTDQLGRDVLARIIYGAKVSIQVGVMAVGISGIIGTVIGLLSGYLGGRFDDLVMRIVDILLAFPGIILAIAVAGFLGPSLTNVVVALSIKSWVSYARLMRGNVLKIKHNEYIQAVEALGAGKMRILFRHLLPNAITPIIVQATMDLGGMIIAEASLSFLGLGPQPPTPSWGKMLSTGRSYITSAWWLAVFPGVAIFLTVMGFNLLGDALRDALDPRMVNKRS